MAKSTFAPVLGIVALLGPALGGFILLPDASAAAGNDGSFVVVAVVDTGINPYHVAFSDATYPRNVDADPANDVDFSLHPSTYITGFPTGAGAIALTFGAATKQAAAAADAAVWDAIEPETLYWIPGTKIIGAYDSGSGFSGVTSQPDSTPILDDDGHGTAAASLVAGHPAWIKHALCRECLIVTVEGPGGLEWAMEQEWIDVVSNSWGTTGNAGFTGMLTNVNPGRNAAERGQMQLFASGNGVEGAFVAPTFTYTSATTGPAWYLRVGGMTVCFSDRDPCPEREEPPVMASGKPMDIAGPATGYIPAAGAWQFSDKEEFSGTSAATPVAAGYAANALLTLRKAMGDTSEGQRAGGVVAAGAAVTGTPFPSIADDGVVTRVEWRDLILYNSAPAVNNTVYRYIPATAPGNYAWFGWGMAAGRAMHQANAAALGEAPWLEKDEEYRFALVDKTMQESLWGTWDWDGDGFRESYRAELQKEAFSLPSQM